MRANQPVDLPGVVPFDDPSPMAVALQHVMNQPPSPRALNADLSPQVEAVILKAIAKKPEERYQSGKELIAALRAALQMVVSATDVVEIPAVSLPPRLSSTATATSFYAVCCV